MERTITPRQAHDLEVHRTIRCWDAHELVQLHKELVLGPHRRAHQLEGAIFYWDLFVSYDLEGRPPNEEESQWADDEPTVVSEVADLLTHAVNLRRLTVDYLQHLMQVDVRVVPALLTMRQLKRAEFGTVGEDAVKFLRTTGWDLHVLSLVYNDEELGYDAKLPQEDRSIRVLIETVAAFPNLHTLKVQISDFAQSFLDIPQYNPPVLPSIRTLHLWAASPAALDIVNLCPNISTVDFELSWEDYKHPEPVEPRVGPQWPPLRSLSLSDQMSIRCAERLLNTAYHLQIFTDISAVNPEDADAQKIAMLVDTLRVVSPIWAQLHVEVGGGPMLFWADVAKVAPRLRYLELKVSLGEIKEENKSWLDNVVDALRPLSITCLRLHLPQLPVLASAYISDKETKDEFYRAYRANLALSKKLYNARVESMETLPQRLADAIPSLKFISFADEGPNSDYETDENGESVGTDDEAEDVDGEDPWLDVEDKAAGGYFARKDKYRYQGGWYANEVKEVKWWRMTREANGGARVEEMTMETGMKVQKLLEDAEFETIEQVDC